MKHVWILNHYAQEPGGAGGTRHFSLARLLPASGWKATLVAASTDHVSGAQRLREGENRRLEIHDGVPFLWLGTSSYKGNGAGRIRNMIEYTRAVLRRGSMDGIDPPDAIVGSSVHPLAAWAGRRLARRHRVPFIFEVRDLWPQTLIDMGCISGNHPAAIALRWLERSLYRSACRIVVLLPGAHSYIERFGIPRDRIVWIPNGVDVAGFAAQPLRRAGEPFTLMYLGAHGQANGLDTLLDAMAIVRQTHGPDDILVRLVGDGPLKASLQSSMQARRLDNVRFEDAVPKHRIPSLAAEADGFVICVKDLPGLYRYGISMNKIFDYMAASRPVIIGVDAANNPVAEAGCGLTVPPQDPEALAAAIVELASLPFSLREEMAKAGRRHLEENYDMKRSATRLANVLDECVANARK